MKVKKIARIAIIGLIMTICPSILNFFIPVSKTLLIGSFMRIIGNVLLIIFFYVYFVKQEESTSLKTAGILGLTGYGIIILLNISGAISNSISNSIFDMTVKDPLKYISLMPFISIISQVSFFIGFIPRALLIACFMIIYKNFSKKDPLKKAALLALIGQFLEFALGVISHVLFVFYLPRLYSRINFRSLNTIFTVEYVAELIPSVLMMIFFITLYRLHDESIKRRRDNRAMQLQIERHIHLHKPGIWEVNPKKYYENDQPWYKHHNHI